MFGFLKKKKEPEKIAKIKFNSSLRMNHPLAKEIHVYQGDKLLDVLDYSDVIVEKLKANGFYIRDETKKMMVQIPVITHWEGGKIQVE